MIERDNGTPPGDPAVEAHAPPATIGRLDAVQIERLLGSLTGVPLSRGNRIEILRNGEEIFPAMLEAIDAAEHSVDLLTFVYWSGDIAREFATAIARAAARGVDVRVLLDGVGAKPMDDVLIGEMSRAGAEVRTFRPPNPMHPVRATHRTHRKVLVCDDTVGFTGGVGIADEWSGDGRTDGCWRDTHLRIDGPAVAGLRGAFLDNWVETTQALSERDVTSCPELVEIGHSPVQVIRGTSQPGWNDVSLTIRSLISLAQERLRITSAYFVPDEDLQQRLVAAAERDVDVSVLLPGPGADKRFVQLAGEARYRELLDAGVQIWSYQPSMLHAKIMTVDRRTTITGSANFNHRSTSLDDEVNVVIVDDDVTAIFDDHFEADLEYAEALDPERWRERSFPQIALERAVDLARPWM